jgi:GDPmannose 4,6-dehydratase
MYKGPRHPPLDNQSNIKLQTIGKLRHTRKIRAATRIKLGLQDKVYLGNLDARRDWSHAKDVAEAMYKIITAPQPSDYVVSSGEIHSVKEFAQMVFSKLGLD